ncbi:hypothetical protein VCV18_001111 [Metarhizium anisopliae]
MWSPVGTLPVSQPKAIRISDMDMDMSMDLFMSLLFPNVGHSGFGGRSIQAKPQQRLAWGVICKKKEEDDEEEE